MSKVQAQEFTHGLALTACILQGYDLLSTIANATPPLTASPNPPSDTAAS